LSDEHGLDVEFDRKLGLFDATMIVAGAMIGSGIFLVSAEMSRLLGSPAWLLAAWIITGVITVAAALSYGELAAMMPRAGGQYVFLRESLSPIWGFLYVWTFLLVIQSGTIAAVGVAFARFTSVLVPAMSETNYIIAPIFITGSHGYAISLSVAQLVAIIMIAVLTITNMLGVNYGKIIQNIFTVAKTGTLLALVLLGLTLARNADAVARNFGDFWTRRPSEPTDGSFSALTLLGLFVALCVAQTGSLFSADSWHNVALIAGEIKDPRRNLPRSLALGAGGVIILYVLANVAYLLALPFEDIQNAPADRVATLMMQRTFPGFGVAVMTVALMISTFGCNNGLILAGARASYALARDGLLFRAMGRLNSARVPAVGLAAQGIWASLLVLPRTYNGKEFGNLYGDLLNYVISAALLFYILTIVGLFRLRYTRPDAERPYRAVGYPIVPALVIVGSATILLVLLIYKTKQTWPGFVIILLGVPFYLLRRATSRKPPSDYEIPNSASAVQDESAELR
jgi:APA family basic amino acid/polyamine antiporter